MSQQTQISAASHRVRSVWLVGSAVLVFGAVVGVLAFARRAVPENVLTLSGRIEGDDSVIAPKTSGRILEIRFREGDRVSAGDVIALLDDQQVRDREQQARAALTISLARERAARSQLAALLEQLLQTRILTSQSRTDAQGRVSQAEADLSSAEAELAQQAASLKLALFDRDAYSGLAESGAVSERQNVQAIATAELQTAVVAAARRRVEASRGALTTAQASLDNPNIRIAQEAVVRQQIAQQEAEIAASVAGSEQARFALSEAHANRNDLTITAPFDGTVITRSAEPGEVVAAGMLVVTLLDLSKVYLRGFVPEGDIGKIEVGQLARVYLDSKPEDPIEAFVSRADPEATFTPENTYFKDDRVKQVVGVKLQIKGALGLAKPGMAADGEILIRGDQWSQGRRVL
jgi:HlyD family secretion protein